MVMSVCDVVVVCDICDEPQHEDDEWNGETGCHIECERNADWDQAWRGRDSAPARRGDNARKMLGLIDSYATVGERYTEARRGANAMRSTEYRKLHPYWTLYADEMAAAGKPTGAAYIETRYGCPSEWNPDNPFDEHPHGW